MGKKCAGEDYALKILNALMMSEKALTTTQLCEMSGCERKTVYASIDKLEISGFHIEKRQLSKREPNRYRFVAMYGM